MLSDGAPYLHATRPAGSQPGVPLSLQDTDKVFVLIRMSTHYLAARCSSCTLNRANLRLWC